MPASLSSVAGLAAASSQHADQRRAEAAISPQPGAPSSGQLIPPTRAIPATAQQPATLAATQDVMQDRLPDWLLTQDVNLPGGAARTERATGHRVQDREFDKPKRVDRPQFIKSTGATAPSAAAWAKRGALRVARRRTQPVASAPAGGRPRAELRRGQNRIGDNRLRLSHTPVGQAHGLTAASHPRQSDSNRQA